MCLTIPAKVTEIEGNFATVRDANSSRKINIHLIPETKVGDWILYAGANAVQKISAEDAREIINLLENFHPPIDGDLLSDAYKKIIENSKNQLLAKEEILYLLNAQSLEKDALFAEADVLRRTVLKDFICIHGIIEFSNYCKNDCAYCGLRAQNSNVQRYRMKPAEIIQAAEEAVKRGYKLLVLQSGEDPYYTEEMLVDIIREIKKRCQVFILISIGERDQQTYSKLKEAGAAGVLFRFETTNKNLFSKFHDKGKNIDVRFEHLNFLKQQGYYIATGSVVGLPGQKMEDIADDILAMTKWANMVSMGPFVPSANTPLASEKAGDPELYYKVVAILRILMPKARIPVVTALETLEGEEGRKKALLAGANSLMLNVTPAKYREDYKIYENRFFQAESLWEKYGLFREEESYQMIKERMEEELEKNIIPE